MKTSIPCCPLTSKSTHFFWTVFACKWCLIFACFSSDSDETRTHILVRSKGLNIKNTLMLDLFLTNMQLLRRSLMDWSGVDYLWIFVMSYQLCGRSFWRHPFTAEDPLVSKWWNATFLQICSDDKETHLHLGWPALRVSTFSANFHFLGELCF